MPRQRKETRPAPHPIYAASLVVAIVATMVVGGTVVNNSTLNADLEVVNATCDGHHEEANITSLTLRVDYRGNETIDVHSHTWDAKRHVQHPWEPRTIALEPGVQTVTIHSPRPRAGITPGERAQVYLNHGQQRVIENWEVREC